MQSVNEQARTCLGKRQSQANKVKQISLSTRLLVYLLTKKKRTMSKIRVWKIVIKVLIAMATTLLGALGAKGDNDEVAN